MPPSTAPEVETILVDLFPDFALHHSPEEVAEAERAQAATLHSIMMPSPNTSAATGDSFSEKQLQELGALNNEAVQIDDDWQNAIHLCSPGIHKGQLYDRQARHKQCRANQPKAGSKSGRKR